MKYLNKQSLFMVTGLAILVAGFFIAQNLLGSPRPDSPTLNIHGSPSPTPSTTAIVNPSHSPTPTPAASGQHILEVPFTAQAPTGNWDALHEEMCEEGTLVMAHAWVNGINLTPAYAESQLQKLAKWGTDNFGTYVDTNARQTAQMGEAVYGLHTRIIDSPSIADIKREIDNGSIVIMGMAGRMLGNPNYTPPGPVYHMILIKGYDATEFITNDDGTRKGNSYHYAYATLMAAAHDWNGDAVTIADSPAVAFVVNKN
jgi:hypothetical protein